MILVDSGVWIDYLRGAPTRASDALDAYLGRERIVIGDLMLTEVLQGCRTDAEFARTRAGLRRFDVLRIVDEEVAVASARHYRTLRAKGITIRKTIDALIASRCIADDVPLLFGDRDFLPFVEHLGLRSALADPGVN